MRIGRAILMTLFILSLAACGGDDDTPATPVPGGGGQTAPAADVPALTQTVQTTGSSGALTLSYPETWSAAALDSIVISEDSRVVALLEQAGRLPVLDTVPAVAFAALIGPNTVAAFNIAADAPIIEVLVAYTGGAARQEALSEMKPFDAAGRSAVVVIVPGSYSTLTAENVVSLVDVGSGSYAAITLTAPVGKGAQYEALVRAITASITFTPASG